MPPPSRPATYPRRPSDCDQPVAPVPRLLPRPQTTCPSPSAATARAVSAPSLSSAGEWRSPRIHDLYFELVHPWRASALTSLLVAAREHPVLGGLRAKTPTVTHYDRPARTARRAKTPRQPSLDKATRIYPFRQACRRTSFGTDIRDGEFVSV